MELEQLFETFFTTYSWQLGLIALAGVVVLGVLKYCKVFEKIENEKTRHFLYFLISVGLSVIGSVIYLACIHQLDAAFVFGLAGAIFALNQGAYAVYSTTPLQTLWNKILDSLVDFIKKIFANNEDDETTTPDEGEGDSESGDTPEENPDDEKPATPILVDIPVAAEGLVYNGEAQVGVAATEYYTVANGSATDAGEYTATVTLTDETKYKWKTEFNGEVIFTIAKAAYDMSKVAFTDSTVTYDGKKHSITVEGELPDGVTVSYEDNNRVDAGTYTITASFSGDEKNHEKIDDMTATLTIEKTSPKVVPEADLSKTIYPTSAFPEITLGKGSTKGTISWEEGQTLKVGTEKYSWKFVPEDTVNYITVIDTMEMTVVEPVEKNETHAISLSDSAPEDIYIHLPALGKTTFSIVGTDTYDINVQSAYGVLEDNVVELTYKVDGKLYLPFTDDYTTQFEIDKQTGYFTINCTPDLYKYTKVLARKWGSEDIVLGGELTKEYTYKMVLTAASGKKISVYLEQD